MKNLQANLPPNGSNFQRSAHLLLAEMAGSTDLKIFQNPKSLRKKKGQFGPIGHIV
jgi:hypothetical protein